MISSNYDSKSSSICFLKADKFPNDLFILADIYYHQLKLVSNRLEYKIAVAFSKFNSYLFNIVKFSELNSLFFYFKTIPKFELCEVFIMTQLFNNLFS